jgi:hypothetical protein
MRNYRTKIRFDIDTGGGTETFFLPVRACRFGVDPYARIGSQYVELFDGRIRPSIDGYHITLSIDWTLLRKEQMDTLRNMLQLMTGTSKLSAQVFLTELSEEGVERKIEMTVEDMATAIGVQYENNIRNTNASLALRSLEVFDTIPTQLTTNYD